MRSMIRFLLLGVWLCIGLQAGDIKPVSAGTNNLPTGNYEGFVMLTAKHNTEGSSSKYNYKISVIWRAGRVLDLNVGSGKRALLTVRGNNLFAAIAQEAESTFSSDGTSCTWKDNIEGEGRFTALPPLDGNGNNFDGTSFTLPLDWEGATWKSSGGVAQGNAQNCTGWGDGLAKILKEKKAIEGMSAEINKISFQITSSTPNKISGTCTLPTWQKGYPKKTDDGTVEHTVLNCSWRVFVPGSKEWKQWTYEGEVK